MSHSIRMYVASDTDEAVVADVDTEAFRRNLETLSLNLKHALETADVGAGDEAFQLDRFRIGAEINFDGELTLVGSGSGSVSPAIMIEYRRRT